MWWILGALLAFVVLALVVDHRRGRPFVSGRQHGRHTADAAATAYALHGPSSGSNTGQAA